MLNTDIETQCREFARQYPSANVLRAVALAEAGTLTWTQIYGLFSRAATAAMAAV